MTERFKTATRVRIRETNLVGTVEGSLLHPNPYPFDYLVEVNGEKQWIEHHQLDDP